jgi:hypothetical protein
MLAGAMPVTPSPIDIAGTVARNLVPLGGIIFLGWSAPTILVLYFADTLFAIAVMFAGLCRYFMPPPKDDGWAARVNSEVGCVGVAIFLAAFFAIPMGMPVFFVLMAGNVSIGSLFGDPEFRAGLVLQAIAAFWSGAGLYRALRTQTPDQLRLKRRFALVFLRWLVVLMATYTGVVFLFGPFAPFIFVAIYAGVSIMIDVAPDKFLRAMPGGAEDADPLPGTTPAAPAAPPQSWKRRPKHKR